jgi:hypothetical protein
MALVMFTMPDWFFLDASKSRRGIAMCRLTTACSDPGHDKVHAPHCICSFGISAYAPHEWCPVADADRYTA